MLHQHQVLRRGDADEISAEGDLTNLPNPWAPATCDDDLRGAIWEWCDAVAEWVNHEYAWRPAQLIPPCWPHHPHIAHELPVLAVLRLAAESSTGPELLEEWHRHTLPGVLRPDAEPAGRERLPHRQARRLACAVASPQLQLRGSSRGPANAVLPGHRGTAHGAASRPAWLSTFRSPQASTARRLPVSDGGPTVKDVDPTCGRRDSRTWIVWDVLVVVSRSLPRSAGEAGPLALLQRPRHEPEAVG